MENHFNYEAVPYSFAHCFNHQCVRNNKCLRHLAAEHCAPTQLFLQIINPACVPEDTGSCPYFRSVRKIRIAWGVKHLLDKVPYKEGKLLKSQMIRRFGRTSYYRYYRKEFGLSTDDQEFIRQIFKENGITEEPVYEYYTEEYQWS